MIGSSQIQTPKHSKTENKRANDEASSKSTNGQLNETQLLKVNSSYFNMAPTFWIIDAHHDIGAWLNTLASLLLHNLPPRICIKSLFLTT